MAPSRAFLFAFFAFSLWVLVDTATKLSTEGGRGLSQFAIMAALGFSGAFSLACVSLFRRAGCLLCPQNIKGQMLVALCNIGIFYANIGALKHLPLTSFYTVIFTTPLMVALFSALLKIERLTRIKVLCALGGFLGVVLSVGLPGPDGNWVGYFWAGVGVMCFASYILATRKLSETDSIESVQFINAFTLGLAGLLGAWLETAAVPHVGSVVVMAGAGVINILGCLLFNAALKHTVSTNVAQFHYTQIITGALLGYLIWHDVPTWNLALGSALIIASGFGVVAEAQILQRSGSIIRKG